MRKMGKWLSPDSLIEKYKEEKNPINLQVLNYIKFRFKNITVNTYNYLDS